MKGYTNSKGNISNEIVNINITGVDNPTFTVSYSGTTTTYTGNITLFIPDGVEYTITFNKIDKYITPESVTYIATKDNLRNINVEYVENSIKDLSLQDVHGNPIQRSTANCYVIKKPGQYKFPLVYGNAIKNGLVNYAAFTNNGGANSHDFVGHDGRPISSPYLPAPVEGTNRKVELTIADTDNIVSDLLLVEESDGYYVHFTIPSVPETGANGVISVSETGLGTDSYTIFWNWHIWLWPHDLTPVEITNYTGVSYNIMPVNLATILDTADSINKTTGWKNWFYQFGRPNPMLCPSAYDSTNNHISYGTLSYTAKNYASNIYLGIRNPATFYKYCSISNSNWFSSNSNKTYNLWDAACNSTGNSDNDVVKTIYDPCPIGFKIPNGNTFTSFTLENVVGSFISGLKFKRYSGDTVGVFFPASGYRYDLDGSLAVVGLHGAVWLSSAYSESLGHGHTVDPTSIALYSASSRSNGYSVRPVEDDMTEVLSFLFTIDQGVTTKIYYATENMTWAEWCASEFNKEGWYINEYGWVLTNTGQFCIIDANNRVVYSTDVITAQAYNIETA